jgi:hypothetical protein
MHALSQMEQCLIERDSVHSFTAGSGRCLAITTQREEGVRFYTRYKSVMQRWPAPVSKGPEFAMPVHK